jgi:heme exporter protein D
MNFQFETLAELWAMKGHGPFVWSAYAITFIALIYLIWSPLKQQRVLLAHIKKRKVLAQRDADAARSSD